MMCDKEAKASICRLSQWRSTDTKVENIYEHKIVKTHTKRRQKEMTQKRRGD